RAAANMADTLDVNQFRCSICLEPYTDPVSIPCGHNFCKLCIEKFWDTSERCCCPLCMEAFYRRPELRVNYSFRDVVNLFKNPSPLTSRKGSEARAGDVACDVCTDVKLKATKSCLATADHTTSFFVQFDALFLLQPAFSFSFQIQVKRRGREVELMIQDRQKRIEEINRSKIQTHVGSNSEGE
uniref:RING-type domain-containing protein n=1 Tax=Stegastes partitus TaxID=144197 RepID=A0A3B5A987_9TELE